MNLQQAANIGGYVSIGGRELLMTPLCLEDYGLAQAYLKTKTPDPMEGIANHCKDLHPEVAKALTLRAYEEHLKWGSLDTNEGRQWASSADGLAFFAFRMTRRNHPDVTMEWLREECAKIETHMLSVIFEKLAEISGMTVNPTKRANRKPVKKKRR